MREIVMLHDHDESIMTVLKLALEFEEFIVIPILDCDDCILDMIDLQRPHVVILDIKMNDEDCIGLCHTIKEKYPHLPVLALSCNINIESLYAQEGFDAYIKKPFDLALLYKVIREHLPKSSKNLNS